MAIYVMGDLHLSLGCEKPMDIFRGWQNYQEQIRENCQAVLTENDTFVIPGDISWGTNLAECLADFQFLEGLPGKKILLKGNHDYFWTTRKKIEDFFRENQLTTLSLLHNNAIESEGYALCGSRGWVNDGSSPADLKVILREAGRLRTSIVAAKKIGLPLLCFLHYPPAFGKVVCQEIFQVLAEEGVTNCYYGHIHGAGHQQAIEGDFRGVRLTMISADHLRFKPLKIT